MKKILTVGVFDLLHWGHFELFRKTRELVGNDGEVIVAIQKDEYVTRYKPNAKLMYDWDVRAKMIGALRYVGKVISYTDIDTSIKDIDFDLWAIGGDQNHDGFKRAIKWCVDNGKEVVRLNRTDGISSSQLRAEGLK